MRSVLFLLLVITATALRGQQLGVPVLDYPEPREFTIADISVTGCVTRDVNAVKLFSGLKVGDRILIPGEAIGKAIKAIWDQNLFSDVRVEAAVYRGFDQELAPHHLTFRHRAGVTPYTSTFVFAESYVFGKQLHGLLSCSPLIVLTTVLGLAPRNYFLNVNSRNIVYLVTTLS